MWVDAGICKFRDTKPESTSFPTKKVLKLLDKKKINYSAVGGDIDKKILEWKYTLTITGTAYIIHKDMINFYCEEFYKYVNKCVDFTIEFTCLVDEVILTRMLFDHPEWFNKIANGYGDVIMY
jgi:succinate dehydrogenase/fumarate reductase flavoprotein subunit